MNNDNALTLAGSRELPPPNTYKIVDSFENRRVGDRNTHGEAQSVADTLNARLFGGYPRYIVKAVDDWSLPEASPATAQQEGK